MKKHLIAAAVAAAVSAPAMAQVTVYGLFDVGYGTTTASASGAKQKQNQVGGRDSSNGNGGMLGSRLGFRGEEDLGGGLKANFVYEVGINPARNGVAETTGAAAAPSGGTPFGNLRNGWVGLSGGFGAIQAGTLNTQVKDIYDSFDPGGGNNFVGTAFGLYSTGREYGAIRYISPNINGLVLRASITPSESNSTNAGGKSDKGTSISARFTQGKLDVAAGRDTRKNVTLTANSNVVDILNAEIARADAGTNTDKITQDVVGASYDFGMAKVSVIHSNVKISDTTAGDNGKAKSTLLGASVPLGAATLFASVTTGDLEDTGAKTHDLSAYQVGVMYSLSKRTQMYGIASQVKADDVGAAVDPKVKQMQVGLIHRF